MGALISYTAESGLVLLACYLVYKWLLAGRNEPWFSRAVILCCYVLAAVLPALWHGLPGQHAGVDAGVLIGLPQVSTAAGDVAAIGRGAGWLVPAIRVVYTTGAAAVLVLTVVSWCRMSRLIARGERRDMGYYELVVVDDSRVAPMSRMRAVVMNREDAHSDVADYILRHELAHIRHRHAVDLLVARAFEVLMWYNPAAWLLASELRAVHEYQADSEVIASGADARAYQMMLIKKVAGLSFQSMANNLNHSKLKKRITMMQKSKSGKGSRVLALAMAPALLVAMSVTRIPAVAGGLDAMSRTTTELPSIGKVSEKTSENAAPEQKKTEQTSPTVDAPERMPEYPGGQGELMMDLCRLLVYPESVKDVENVNLLVVARFVVETDGSISSPEIVKSGGEPYDSAVLEALKKLTKRFTPGTVDGKPVPVHYAIPVTFKSK
ncbi:MAG: M56 family metallopeptidase [Muribaculaceae bacterium]|nr:M56 family metallopeptidase [Muribaculaceae bacterium]